MKIFSFDLGSGSIGECVRKDDKILHLDSLLLDKEFASTKNQVKVRRGYRTRLSHKAREKWWEKCAADAGIEVLCSSPQEQADKRLLREFPAEGDDTIYTSCLLRIALLQGKKLESWQIYKAVRSAFQHRGYDKDIEWGSEIKTIREKVKNNEELSSKEKQRLAALAEENKAAGDYDNKLKELFSDETFRLPSYYEAYKLGLWAPEKPDEFKTSLSSNPAPARNKGDDKKNMLVAPRSLVIKELQGLLKQASKQFPKLKDKENYIIFGPSEKAYAAVTEGQFKKYRGKEWEYQGLLGQKTPRFDNRIISKCRLIARLNVCKAEDELNKEVSFLLALKNMRFTYGGRTEAGLEPEQLGQIFNDHKARLSGSSKDAVTSKDWKKEIQNYGGEVNEAQKSVPMPKFSGRSSFCRPALGILKELILSGKNPHSFYNEKTGNLINNDPLKGLTKEDYFFLLKMPNDWTKIHIPDTREEDKKLTADERKEKIEEILNKINNPVVKHRLWLLVERFKKLEKEHGMPDNIILEVAHNEFMSEEKIRELEFKRNKNRKEIEAALKTVEDTGLNVLKMRLFKQQNCIDIYDTSDNRTLIETNFSDYEVDHIVPRSLGGSDGISNKILTKKSLNAEKLNQTPYEWLYKDEKVWAKFLENIKNAKNMPTDKKRLLISDRAAEMEQIKNDLQATAHIEKLAQQLAALYFGCGLNTKDDERKIFVVTGGKTAAIRRQYGLDRLLHTGLEKDEFKGLVKQGKIKEKNRENKKHHALDALVLSVAREYHYNTETKQDEAPKFFTPPFCASALDKVFPREVRTVKPALRESISALRKRIVDGEEKYFFVNRFGNGIENFLKMAEIKKSCDKIFDTKIKKDFTDKLSQDISQEDWEKFLKSYCGYHEQKKFFERIKKLTLITDRCPAEGFGKEDVFNEDGSVKAKIREHGEIGKIKGQWFTRKEKTHGMIIYKEKIKKGERWVTETVSPFESPYKKMKAYEEKYGTLQLWQSGDRIELKNNIPGNIVKKVEVEFNGKKKKVQKSETAELKKGLYRLNTISKSDVILTNLTTGEKCATSLSNLLDNGKAQKAEDK